ncbi:hypothetical protein KGP36_06430 [Patescibacteria group bacterium]|nr:hypothetical protein [Patescibacteria group bacterium]
MRRIIDDTDSGLEALLGETVTFFCLNYIYTGKLVGVNDKFVLLEEPKIVYETGPFGEKQWKDAQALPHELYVMLSAVESFGLVK